MLLQEQRKVWRGMSDKYTCSIGSVCGTSHLSKTIIFFERLRDRPGWNPFILGDADKSHTFIMIDKDTIAETHINEGMRQKPATIYDGMRISVYRPKFLNDYAKYNMRRLIDYMTGEKYGTGKIALLALDGIFRTFWFSKKFGITSFKVCSNVVGWLYQKTPTWTCTNSILWMVYKGTYNHHYEQNYKFGCDWKSLTPDKCEDWMRAHPDDWEKVV